MHTAELSTQQRRECRHRKTIGLDGCVSVCVFVLELLWHPQCCFLAGKCNVNLLPFNLALRKDSSVRQKEGLFSYDYLYSLDLPTSKGYCVMPAPLQEALVLVGLDKHLQGAPR